MTKKFLCGGVYQDFYGCGVLFVRVLVLLHDKEQSDIQIIEGV
ncbi:hypothetical protein [Peribacillus frigoritolerans]|uniref:Uncharacterized protein n=1 Tax=Peribacillus castrilensis TaxID=2897690 RepID=A0AAW9NGU0_9BACI|nr:hypothetical protein [Peribacillus castrilensis]